MKLEQHPEIAVGAIIQNKKGEILLIKSPNWGNQYTIIGGKVKLGESMEKAIKREIKEETKLEVSNLKFICCLESIFDPIFWQQKHFIFIDFVCTAHTNKVTLNDQESEYVWIDPKKSLKLDLEPYSEKTIKTFLKKF